MSLQRDLQSRLSFARLALRSALDAEDPGEADIQRGNIRQADAALGACCRFPPVSGSVHIDIRIHGALVGQLDL